MLWFAGGMRGSEKGPWSSSGESIIIVPLFESFDATDPSLGDDSSDGLDLPVDTFFTLPTRTTMARAGVAVWAVGVFGAQVEGVLLVIVVKRGVRWCGGYCVVPTVLGDLMFGIRWSW